MGLPVADFIAVIDLFLMEILKEFETLECYTLKLFNPLTTTTLKIWDTKK